MRATNPNSKLPLLLTLYFAQGLPFGFQATALPLILRERGASLELIGFASLLSLPWLLKALWAPLVDRYGSRRFGRRRSWIVAMQAALSVTALVGATQLEHVHTLAALILLLNLFAATQDIAVDALAVSMLRSHQLGLGNAAQVVGYKLGMLTGGGLLVWASGSIGWRGLFYALSALMGLVLLVSMRIEEPAESETSAPVHLPAIGAHLVEAARKPATLALLAVVVTYKSGEALADAMWKPMLLDRGFHAAQLGLWAGTFGMLCSLAGSALSGFTVRRVALQKALFWLAVLRAFGVLGEWWVSHAPESSARLVVLVTCGEHLFGGALTTVVFALMMAHTDPRIGGTHYTLLASAEVLGKLPLAALSGVLAAKVGYEPTFALAAALSVGFALLVGALARPLARAHAAALETG